MPRSRVKRPKGSNGPPDALTKAAHELVVQAVRNGAPITHAAGYAGVHRETLRRWIRNGQGPKPERPDYLTVGQHRKALDHWRRCVALCGALEQAEGQFVLAQLVTIRQEAANGDWRAARFLLESRFPDEFAIRREITGAGGGPVEVSNPAQDRERLLQLLGEYRERQEAT